MLRVTHEATRAKMSRSRLAYIAQHGACTPEARIRFGEAARERWATNLAYRQKMAAAAKRSNDTRHLLAITRAQAREQ